jgi:hypothetical protein
LYLSSFAVTQKLNPGSTGLRLTPLDQLPGPYLSALTGPPSPIAIPDSGLFYSFSGDNNITTDGKHYIGAYSPESRRKRIERYALRRHWAVV